MTASSQPHRGATLRSDAFWAIALATMFLGDIAITWRLWGTPIIDCGREMNQPLRLLRGEMLYSDVRHIYGPLSPYLNALLFRSFGASLDVLYAGGIVCAALIVALVYRIARRLLEPAGAAAAAAIVIATCVVSHWGSYVLPYAYAAVHGCALGLVTLDLLLGFVVAESRGSSGSSARLVAAGIAAALTTLAKTEAGLVALAAGLVAIAVAGAQNPRRLSALAACFVAPVILVVFLTYLAIASRVGWHTLIDESFLLVFLSRFPDELLYFNRKISGMDDVGGNAWLLLLGSLRLGLLAGLVAATGAVAARLAAMSGGVPRNLAWRVGMRLVAAVPFVFAAATFALLETAPIVRKLRWSQGVLRGLPLVLAVVLSAVAWRFVRRRDTARQRPDSAMLLVLFVFALLSLARIVLRTTIETAYSPALLPAAIIALSYLAVSLPQHALREPADRAHAQFVAIVFLFVYAAWSGGLLAKRCLTGEWESIVSDRGTMRSLPEAARAFNAAIRYVLAETGPGDPVPIFPEGTAIDFFTDRRNPLREEIITPGYLDERGESRAIARLEATHTRVVLIENRPTSEFGAAVFGRDYCTRLMAWIEERFEPVATLGDATDATPLGKYPPFFIRAYRRK
jgi:4-amino-4-deoxy-L-arabinose transferase-like glycosyltransferase